MDLIIEGDYKKFREIFMYILSFFR